MVQLRSFNPLLKQIPSWSGKKLGLKALVDPAPCQAVIDKLDLKLKYPDSKNLDIIDVFSGYGLFSSMLNYELNPRKHVLMETHKSCGVHYQSIFEALNGENSFVHYNNNGFHWSTYTQMIQQDHIISPKVVSEDKINDELLIVGNLTSITFGESLFAQWLMCCAHHNWLQKYGRVRMICTVHEETAQKFLSGPGFAKRNRTSIKRDVYTDCRLVAITEVVGDNYMPNGDSYDPNVLVRDQPVILPIESMSPTGSRVAIIEVEPKPKPPFSIESLDFIIQILMFRASNPLSTALKFLGPGAEEGLFGKLDHLLDVTPREMTAEQLLEVVKAFESWTFKPNLEERLSLNPYVEGES